MKIHLSNIGLHLRREGRSLEPGNAALTREIGRCGTNSVSAKPSEQIGKVSDPCFNIGRRIETILGTKSFGCSRHELHKSDGSLVRDCLLMPIGFDSNNGSNPGFSDRVLPTIVTGEVFLHELRLVCLAGDKQFT